MPENALPQPTPKPPAPPSLTPPGGTATSATPPAPAATATAPVAISTPSAGNQAPPAWAAELIEAAKALNAQRPQPQAPQAPPSRFDDDAIMTGRDFRTQADGFYQQQVAPQIQSAWEMAASATDSAAQIRYAKEYEKYGDEIRRELGKLPAQHRTLDNIGTVVTLIKGRHADDYAREEAQRIVSQMDTTIRPMGGGSSPTPQTQQQDRLESDDIPAEWRQRAKQAGINQNTLNEFLRSNDMTEEQFWNQFPKGSPLQPIVAEAGNRGR